MLTAGTSTAAVLHQLLEAALRPGFVRGPRLSGRNTVLRTPQTYTVPSLFVNTVSSPALGVPVKVMTPGLTSPSKEVVAKFCVTPELLVIPTHRGLFYHAQLKIGSVFGNAVADPTKVR